METSTFDVASSAARLKEAIASGQVMNDELADLVLDRIERVKGITDPVQVDDGAGRAVTTASAWLYTWKWIV